MFFQMVFYQINRWLHTKENLFWSLAFPIILGTLFSFAFGSIMERDETFNKIPIAVVQEENSDQAFLNLLEELSDQGENQLFSLQKTNVEKAKELLDSEQIEGYFLVSEEPSLYVSKTQIHQNIMKEVLDKYKQTTIVIKDLIVANPTLMKEPEKINTLVKEMENGNEYTQEISFTSGNQDTTLMYFYALIAMICIYGCFWGIDIICALEANLSALGARRMVTPVNKFKILLADGLAAFLVHIVEIFIVLMYLIYILHVDFGNQIGYIMLASAVGSIIGITFGIFVAALVKGSKALKTSVVLGFSMIFCFLSGLMMHNMKYIVEKYAPIINRINPCALLTDCLYSLNIYETKDAYFRSLIYMLIIAALLITGSFLIIRRRKYASI